MYEIVAPKKAGRPPKYTPDTLTKGIRDYIDWVKDNPIVNEKVSVSNGEPVPYYTRHPRPLLQSECCRFLGLSYESWCRYRKSPELRQIVEEANSIFDEQKLALAVNGIYKENIIARLLGLTEKKETKVTGIEENTNTERLEHLKSELYADQETKQELQLD